MSWSLLESDPAVFTDLLTAIGVKGLQLEELYSLDDISLDAKGLFFLFKWKKGRPADRATCDDAASDGPIFLRQVIPNACGTLALLHVLLNRAGLDIGEVLTGFRDFVAELPAEDRGMALGSCDPIRIAHNSFARPEPFVSDEREADDDDDAFHFVAYTNKGDQVYEFDGLQAGPRLLGTTAPGEHWIPIVQQHLQARILEYSASEIRFNLLALVKSRLLAAEERVALVLQQLRQTFAALETAGAVDDAAPPDAVAVGLGIDVSSLPSPSPTSEDDAMGSAARRDTLMSEYVELQRLLAQAAAALESEKAQRAQWSAENDRRRHNYVPLVMEVMKQLARRGKLLPLLDTGIERARSERAKALARRREAATAASKGTT